MISKISNNNISFGQLKIADNTTKERLEKTMQDVELRATIQKGLANIDKESGDDLVILSSEYCPETPNDGIMCGSREGYRLILKTANNVEIGRNFIASGFNLKSEIASLFNELTSAVKNNKNSAAFKDSGLDQYM